MYPDKVKINHFGGQLQAFAEVIPEVDFFGGKTKPLQALHVCLDYFRPLFIRNAIHGVDNDGGPPASGQLQDLLGVVTETVRR